jgi:hypothetical protein
MATMILSESWEDFEVPELVIQVQPPPPPVHIEKPVSFPLLAKEKHIPKILTETEKKEKEQHDKELAIAFEKAKQKYIDYQIKTVYTTYNRMNAMGKKKTMEKILKEIKDCKYADAIIVRLQIQTIVDTGGILGGMECG